MRQDDGDRRRDGIPPDVQKAFKILEDAIRRQQRRARQAKAATTYLQLLKQKKTAGLLWLVVQLGGL